MQDLWKAVLTHGSIDMSMAKSTGGGGGWNHLTTSTIPTDKPAPTRRRACKTCKQKHIKCDRAMPSCQKCQSKGNECGGYGYPDKFQPNLSTVKGKVKLWKKHFATIRRLLWVERKSVPEAMEIMVKEYKFPSDAEDIGMDRLLAMGLLPFPEKCQICKDAGLCYSLSDVQKGLPPKHELVERFWNAHENLLMDLSVTKRFSSKEIRLEMVRLGHCQISNETYFTRLAEMKGTPGAMLLTFEIQDVAGAGMQSQIPCKHL
ncbi:hypothetical protein V2G26_007228 [Clonostachys chloroleuca]